MVSVRKAGVIALAVIAVACSPATVASGAENSPAWRGADLRYGSGAGLRACVDAAQRLRPTSWVCVGGTLTTPSTGGGVRSRVVQADVADTTGDLRTLADDYDTWCELQAVCGRRISAYIAEVKGNGVYGDREGAIGGFDFIVRQQFNGQWPRWRSLLIYEWGPAVTPNQFLNVCRKNVPGPDQVCGNGGPILFGTVSAARKRSWWPSSTSLRTNSQKTRDGGQYHDDNYGSFHAAGHSQTFYAKTIHTGRWSNCNVSPYCRYYQVPWRE